MAHDFTRSPPGEVDCLLAYYGVKQDPPEPSGGSERRWYFQRVRAGQLSLLDQLEGWPQLFPSGPDPCDCEARLLVTGWRPRPVTGLERPGVALHCTACGVVHGIAVLPDDGDLSEVELVAGVMLDVTPRRTAVDGDDASGSGSQP